MLIEFEGVNFNRGQQKILRNLNWQMADDDNWAILGLNGSGKTTMLKMITGYLWPSNGELTVLGERFKHTSIPELRKRIGWISTDLQHRLRENDLAEEIVLSGKFASIGIWQEVTQADKNKAKETLKNCGAEKLIGKKYAVLSQGERQLVLIARALMADPELLIFDEPCNGLDIFARDGLLKKIDQISVTSAQTGLIFVTHYIEEIPQCFNKVMLLKDGQIFAAGDRKDIFQISVLNDFYESKVEITALADQRFSIMPKA
ncbi:MAG TPA: ABC transporter ATP-binding protein [Tetragenococcus sp.]|nr:ABC transporter ATP-binding protein [Tetragenococcus sp.]